MSDVKPIPYGHHSVTAHLVVRNANEAIEFYKMAFAAEELFRVPTPDGKFVLHATIQIGDSILMLCDEFPAMERWLAPQSLEGTTVALHIWSEDVDAAFERAVKAGAKVAMPLIDAFWGDRYGRLRDPFGHEWTMATHMQDLTAEEIGKATEAYFSKMECRMRSAECHSELPDQRHNGHRDGPDDETQRTADPQVV